MSCFSLILIFLLGSNTSDERHFVQLIKNKVEVKKEAHTTTVWLPFEIQEGFHIQPVQTLNVNMIATKIEFDEDYSEIKASFIADNETIRMGQDFVDVISNTFTIKITFKSSEGTSFNGRLFYQACDNRKCYFPRTLTFEIQLE